MRELLKKALLESPPEPAIDRVMTSFFRPRAASPRPAVVLPFPSSFRSLP